MVQRVWKLLDILEETSRFFAARGLENARLQAELLLAAVLEIKRLDLYLQFERPLHTEEVDAYRDYVRQRVQRVPVQYILGATAFRDLLQKKERDHWGAFIRALKHIFSRPWRSKVRIPQGCKGKTQDLAWTLPSCLLWRRSGLGCAGATEGSAQTLDGCGVWDPAAEEWAQGECVVAAASRSPDYDGHTGRSAA